MPAYTISKARHAPSSQSISIQHGSHAARKVVTVRRQLEDQASLADSQWAELR